MLMNRKSNMPCNPGEDFIKRFTVVTITSHLPVYDSYKYMGVGEHAFCSRFTGVTNVFLMFAERVH